jgi:hypothetical protein
MARATTVGSAEHGLITGPRGLGASVVNRMWQWWLVTVFAEAMRCQDVTEIAIDPGFCTAASQAAWRAPCAVLITASHTTGTWSEFRSAMREGITFAGIDSSSRVEYVHPAGAERAGSSSPNGRPTAPSTVPVSTIWSGPAMTLLTTALVS